MSKHADEALNKLICALSRGRSDGYCLSLWSAFVQTRDGDRCVLCDGAMHLSAHHIARKCFVSIARYDPGNGITLCRECHAAPHEAFNSRPDMSLPTDAQGGENIDLMM